MAQQAGMHRNGAVRGDWIFSSAVYGLFIAWLSTLSFSTTFIFYNFMCTSDFGRPTSLLITIGLTFYLNILVTFLFVWLFVVPQILQACVSIVMTRLYGGRGVYAAITSSPLTALVVWFSLRAIGPDPARGSLWPPSGVYLSLLIIETILTLISLAHLHLSLAGRLETRRRFFRAMPITAVVGGTVPLLILYFLGIRV